LQVISGKISSTKVDLEGEVALSVTKALEKEVTAITDSGRKYAINIFFDDDSGMENLRAFFIVNQLNEAGAQFYIQARKC